MRLYTDSDPYCCAWVKNLIAVGALPFGDVICSPIQDLCAGDVEKYTQRHWFCGIGGWALALQMAGAKDLCCDTASLPCQPFSCAGKSLGVLDERHIWEAFYEIISELMPITLFGEQVTGAITKGWFDSISADLEEEGYAVGAVVLGAHTVKAPHIRQRLFWVADAEWNQQQQKKSCGGATRRVGGEQQSFSWDISWESALSSFRTMDDGVPRSVAGTDAIRNAIVPQVASEFIQSFLTTKNEKKNDNS